MNKISYVVLSIIMIMFLSMSASAATLNVGPGQTYSTDGVADQTEINQAALDANPGDVVYLHAATYTISAPIILDGLEGIKIKGDGVSNTKIKPVSYVAFLGTSPLHYSFIEFFSCQNIEMYDIKIEGVPPQIQPENYDSDPNNDDSENGMCLYSCSGMKIHDMVFTVLSMDGIYSDSSDNIEVYNCVFDTDKHDCIQCWGGDNWNVTNCNFNVTSNSGVRYQGTTDSFVNKSTFNYVPNSNANGGLYLQNTVSNISSSWCIYKNYDETTNIGAIYAREGDDPATSGDLHLNHNVFYNNRVDINELGLTVYESNSVYASTLEDWTSQGYGYNAQSQAGNPPVAEFAANTTSGTLPKSIRFTDASTGSPASWSWDFGDGNTSTSQNPTHTYTNAGTYTVSLTATNAYGNDVETKTNYITINKATPVINWDNPSSITYGTALSSTQLNAQASVNGNYVYTPSGGILSAGNHVLHVDFTPEDSNNYNDVSKNVTLTINKASTSITWENPDNIVYGTALDENQLNAVASIDGQITYNPIEGTVLNVGTHILSCTFAPTDSTNYTGSSKSVNITVTSAPTPPDANFNCNVTNGDAPLTVGFTDTSLNSPTSWSWDFGDGNTSTSQNPIHTYTNAGTYTVNLTATNVYGSDNKTQQIIVSEQQQPPAGNSTFAFITNFNSDNIKMINLSTNVVAATINVGDGPMGVAVLPDKSKAYITNANTDTVSIINTSSKSVESTVYTGDAPRGAVANSAGTRVYISNYGSDTVSVINPATDNVIADIDVGYGPTGICINPAGTRVYVSNFLDDTISVINTATNTVIDTISVSASPWGIAVSPDGNYVYVTHFDASTLWKIDTSTNNVIDGIDVESSPIQIAISPDGSEAYVTNYGGDSVSVVGLGSFDVTDTIINLNLPRGVSFTSDGEKAYIVNQGNNTVSVFNTDTKTKISDVVVGSGPMSLGAFI